MLGGLNDAANHVVAAAGSPGPVPGEAEVWDGVRELIGDEHITLGHHWSFNLRNDPKRFPFVLSRYKFAAKMAVPGTGPKRSVLELGCSEGLGTMILAEFASRYHGVDLDGDAVATAKQNWTTDTRTFETCDFLAKTAAGERFDGSGDSKSGGFDAVVSLDVIEHISTEAEPRYWEAVTGNLADDGVAVIGTPNQTSEQYASPMSKAGHINLFTGPRMVETMRRHFENVLLFGLNDEVVHTGFSPMTHYVMGVGIHPKRNGGEA